MASSAPAVKRSVIYIDGFNFYYGAIQGGPHRWLNLQRYFTMLRPHDDIQAIRYFTARINGSHAAHQDAYLKALSTLPLVDITLGGWHRFLNRCGFATGGLDESVDAFSGATVLHSNILPNRSAQRTLLGLRPTGSRTGVTRYAPPVNAA